ncbi:DUF968 domain-containing protein [Klebsiella sp. RHBSTW-00484]|uniref:DUF968 domain-containing protein n=1 Tax=unclassified Klebsiella TaxID=2608929 RepID=UPI0015E4B464|nr:MULTISPECIES: DUF968 domain-containing protein [unclassified Klebsiella]QLO37327.1 DUF968 domain-containing protein [Klebsiella sp. RHBSTW-00484]QLT76845.1 DUF968 domain-containing protein [Klebsiella sp. RHBSTW-00464]
MRALLNVDIARHLGIVLLKPGSELMRIFGKGRVLVEMPPAEMDSMPSGCVPDARQPLAEDSSLHVFFSDERVILAAGGLPALERWLLLRVKKCQYPHSEYHHNEMVTMRHPPGALLVCWHCDNKLREQATPELGALALRNVADWVIDTVLIGLGYNKERSLSIAELCWWAVQSGIADAITETLAQRGLRLPDEPFLSVYKESDIVPSIPATSILAERVTSLPPASTALTPSPPRPVLSVKVVPEAPATFFARPKRIRWESLHFLAWVKTQPCMCCGQPADDAHHLIGWGQGGVGTKAHDIFTIPLCRKHHRQLHENPRAFEREYGTQPVLIIKLLDRAYALGVLA